MQAEARGLAPGCGPHAIGSGVADLLVGVAQQDGPFWLWRPRQRARCGSRAVRLDLPVSAVQHDGQEAAVRLHLPD